MTLNLRILLVATAAILTSLGFSEETYLGIYIQDQKSGYAHYKSTPDTLNGVEVERNESTTVMEMKMLDTVIRMDIQTETWTDQNGRPIKGTYITDSGNRKQIISATFNEKTIDVYLDSAGAKSKKVLQIPEGLDLQDDPIAWVLNDGFRPGASKTFGILDPTTISIVRNTINVKGPAETEVKGQTVQAQLVEVVDPRATMYVYVTSKGDIVKIEGPLGMEMIPEPKEIALDLSNGGNGSPDLGLSSKIVPEPRLRNPGRLTNLKVKITGVKLDSAPSGEFQTAKHTENAWILDIHPVDLGSTRGKTIQEAVRSEAAWTKPDTHIPADSEKFRRLSRDIIGTETDVRKSAYKVQKYVHGLMKQNYGIGVLRDASEVLETKEGVCRDYAILTATLLRAAEIPTRLASGLVSWDGDFYYHAWVEIWDGNHWIGIDSTTPNAQIAANHIKLAHGNVQDAFTFKILEGAKIEVLDAETK